MGFYVVARNKKNEDVASVSFEVWNANIQHLYEALQRENPYGALFSGTGESITYSLVEMQRAYQYAESQEYYCEAKREALHPIVLIFSGAYPMQMDPEKDRNRLLLFFSECMGVAEQEGNVTLHFS